MTCYWDSIRDSLNLEDYNKLGLVRKPSLGIFINTLKLKNKKIDNVFWQGNGFRNQEKQEHYDAINEYNINKINDGHLTSVCDSFLLLLCELLEISIEHKYNNINISYKNKRKSRKTLFFKSNKGHFEINHYKKQGRPQPRPQPRPQTSHIKRPIQPYTGGIGLNFSIF
jgi:hypothetical protein